MDLVQLFFLVCFVHTTNSAIVPALTPRDQSHLSSTPLTNCATNNCTTTNTSSTVPSSPKLPYNPRNGLLFSSKRRSRIRTFGKPSTTTTTNSAPTTTNFPSTTTTTTTKRPLAKRHHDLQFQPSFLSEISVNHPHLSKPLAMYKRPAGKSDFMGLGVLPPRGSPAAKGPFKPSIIYKGLIRKQKPGMQFKRTPNGPPPLPPPLPPSLPSHFVEKAQFSKGKEMSIPSEHASQFSISDPKRGTYKFGYDTGTVGEQSYRFEKRDPDGKVTGKYGYIDPEGVLREVNYVADAQGYRPTLVNRYKVDMHFPFVAVPSKLTFT